MRLRKATLASGQLLRSVHMKESYRARQGGLPGVVQRVTRLSKLPRATKNSCEQLQASDRAPRQS